MTMMNQENGSADQDEWRLILINVASLQRGQRRRA